MQINYPRERHGLPPEHEVRDIILVLCHECGWNHDNVRLQYIGGDRRKYFPKQGIKLMRGCQFTVQLYVGCDNETVETHFQLINGNGRARPGHELYQEMIGIFSGRMMIVTDEMIRELRTGISGNVVRSQQPEQPTVVVSDDTVSDGSVDQNEIVDDASSTTPAPKSSEPSPEPQAPLADPVHYKKYFDDPSKLHLGVCALVAMCDEDTQKPFSFGDFEKVIAELDVPTGNISPMVFIRVFTTRGFVIRLNPESKPSRYAITAAAVDFALGPIPNSLIKTKMQIEAEANRKRTPSAKPKADIPKTDIKQSLLELRAKADEHKVLEGKLTAVKNRLAKLQEVDITAEEKNAKAEITSHQKRIDDLRVFLDDLEKRKGEIQATEKESEHLNKALSDPHLLQALSQLEEFKKLLS